MRAIKKIISSYTLDFHYLHDGMEYVRAIESKDIKRLHWLIDNNYKISDKFFERLTPLHWAAFSGDIEIFKTILNYPHADIKKTINYVDKMGRTALHNACIGLHTEIVREILKIPHVNVDLKDSQGHSALSDVSMHSSNLNIHEIWDKNNHLFIDEECVAPDPMVIDKAYDCAKLLIEKGADVNQQNAKAWSPLGYAIFKGNKKLVSLLLDNHAQFLVKNTYERYDFENALKFRNPKMVRMLLERIDNEDDLKIVRPLCQQHCKSNPFSHYPYEQWCQNIHDKILLENNLPIKEEYSLKKKKL